MYYEDPELNDDRQYAQNNLDNNGKNIFDDTKDNCTKELRIGNFVNDTDGTFHIVSATYRNGIEMEFEGMRYFIDEDVVRPIELTEEWLLKFGFEKGWSDNDNRIQITSDCSMSIWTNNQNPNCLIGDDLSLSVKYVHQLQNLYFALTGFELPLTALRLHLIKEK